MRRSLLGLWGPFLGSLAVVFWVSSLSVVPGAHYFWDKLLHALGYTGLGVLALRAFHGGFERLRVAPTVFAGIAVIVWALSDEFHQSFVPGRDAELSDVLADGVGFALSVLMAGTWTFWRSRARQPR